MLCANWRSKGHATALGWAVTQPALRVTIDAIEAEVKSMMCTVVYGVKGAYFVFVM